MSSRISKLCIVSNVGWMFISLIGVVGAVSHSSHDYLFICRYMLALASSGLSFIAIKVYQRRIVGRLSILFFMPFILLELVELWAVHRCSSGAETVWGMDCSSLVMYRDDSRYIQLITDELAVLFLSLANLWILWRCHMTQGHVIYDSKKLRKVVSPEPFLSAVSSDREGGVCDFISVDESSSPTKVYTFSLVPLAYRFPSHRLFLEFEGCLNQP